MATFSLTAQDVNGDPYVSGKEINIVTGAHTDLTFIDVDNRLGAVQTGEYVSLDGGTTLLSYRFLGYADVRGDDQQHAGFIRVDMGDGTFRTFAIDMNADGDGLPDLQNGNTQLRTSDLDPGPTEPYPVPPCFVAGTLIRVPGGAVPVEEIAVDDLVETLDHGPQTVRWIGRRAVPGTGDFAPVRIEAGALGNARTLMVSPQHRMLLSGWMAELYFGEVEVLVAATHLIGKPGIARCPVAEVEYLHLLFDRHEIVFSEGAPSESFHPDSMLLERDRALRAEIEAIFPEFAARAKGRLMPTARRVVTGREARLLAA